MQYGFDRVIYRSGTRSQAWNAQRELPLRGADMAFRTAPEIVDIINAKAEHGAVRRSTVPYCRKETALKRARRMEIIVDKWTYNL